MEPEKYSQIHTHCHLKHCFEVHVHSNIVIDKFTVLRLFDTQIFTAKGFDQNDEEMTITPIWSTNSGTIGQDGNYTATQAGDFTVTASVEGSAVTGTASVHVTSTGVDRQSDRQPEKFALYQNYPNPFNSQTAIEYSIKENCRVVLKIYDIRGCEVTTLVAPPSAGILSGDL